MGVGVRVMLSYNRRRVGTVVREYVRDGYRLGVFVRWDDGEGGELRYLDDEPLSREFVIAPPRQITSRLQHRRGTYTRFQKGLDLGL